MVARCFATSALIGLLIGPQGVAASTDSQASYAVSVPVLTAQSDQGLLRVALPLPVLRHLRSTDRRDLRVFNGAGEPVPMAWAGAPLAAVSPPRWVDLPRFVWPTQTGAAGETDVNIELRADGAVVRVERRGSALPPAAGATAWLLDLSALADGLPQALELHWATEPADRRGILRTVIVFASADAKRWRRAGEGTVFELRDAPGTASLRQQRIALQGLERGDRYLRLQFADALALQAVQAEVAAVASLPVLDSERLRPQRSSPRSWTLDTGAELPVRRLQVHVAEDNSVLPLVVARRPLATPADRAADDWITVASHTAYRMVRDGSTVTSPPLELDGTAVREWRMTLDARTGPVERGPELTLWWPAVQLVFAARGPGPFALALGREAAVSTSLDRSVLIPGYREGDEFKLPTALLGAPVVRSPVKPSLTETLAGAEPERQRRWILWATLVAAVAVLAVLAWRLGRDLHDGGARPPAP